MMFIVVITGRRAFGIFIVPLWKRGAGGFEKTNTDRRDVELFTIYKISPDPSLPKRGTKGCLLSPLFHHTIRYRAQSRLTPDYQERYSPSSMTDQQLAKEERIPPGEGG